MNKAAAYRPAHFLSKSWTGRINRIPFLQAMLGFNDVQTLDNSRGEFRNFGQTLLARGVSDFVQNLDKFFIRLSFSIRNPDGLPGIPRSGE
jgi:hypothetical protein